ncbi:MAG: hypothetical protein WCF36_11775, partial [Candidatus Nanopelagicales bacterium]
MIEAPSNTLTRLPRPSFHTRETTIISEGHPRMTTQTIDYSQPPGTSLRVRVQKFGTFLSNMIMPNIAAIIAWGLLTALFIPDGWLP